MVVNGQIANQTTFNTAFMSRTAASTSTTATVALINALPESGPNVTNLQRAMNKAFEGVGTTGEADADINYYGPSPNYVGNGDSRKAAIVKLDGQLKTAQDGVDSLEPRVSDIESGNSTFNGVKTFANDVVVQGDFTVSGTTTFINSEDLNVADRNITVNKGGTDISSEGAGIDVEREGTNGGVRFSAALASKWAVGLVDNLKEIIVSGVDQVISGVKDFTGTVIFRSQLWWAGSSSGTLVIQVPAVLDNYTLTLPEDAGEADQVLATDGAGVTRWVDQSGGGGGGGETPPQYIRISSVGAGTLNVPSGAKYIIVTLKGGGGGGGGSQSSSGAPAPQNGAAGTASTFESTAFVAGGGYGGVNGGSGGAGQAGGLASGAGLAEAALIYARRGQGGFSAAGNTSSSFNKRGGNGGGLEGGMAYHSVEGWKYAGQTHGLNGCGGCGGGDGPNTSGGGGGGGEGAEIKFILHGSLASSYSYFVGSGGAGGGGGGPFPNVAPDGGNGGNGFIDFEIHF